MDAEFSKKAREAKGLAGGVIRLVFMCAFLLPLGDSLGSAFGGSLPPFIPIDVNILYTISLPTFLAYRSK